MNTITREEAFALLKKYNKDPFHIQHALTVEAVMKWYANELGYGVVPIDKFDREYRETTGRVCTRLAKKSKSVVRIICGMECVLKDE